ncbi:hypothetical protein [Thioclava sp. GXIMD4215]|uniref:hypothetical protein n=1 Tax=Thioclava sp. GXIMD4215 TaxID=3131928 RepID=UPI003250CE04
MVTILRRLPYLNPGSVGLPSIIPTQDELDIMAKPELLYWLRGDSGLTDTQWKCRKTGLAFTVASGTVPTPQDMPEYDGRTVARFNVAGAIAAVGAQPTSGPFSWVLIGRGGTSNAYVIGSGDDPSTSSESRTLIQHTVGGILNAVIGGVTAGNTSSYSRPPTAGPNVLIASHDDVAQQNGLRANYGQLDTLGTAGSATRNTFDSTLVVGAAGQPEGTLTGRINGGDIADVMVWSVALHLRTDLRDLVERYSQARYPSVGT